MAQAKATTPTWTEAELNEFDTLSKMLSDPDQMARITARLKLRAFVAKHGKGKCDAMFAVLKASDAKRRK